MGVTYTRSEFFILSWFEEIAVFIIELFTEEQRVELQISVCDHRRRRTDDLFQILLQVSPPVSNNTRTKTGSKFRHEDIKYTKGFQMADNVEALGLNSAKFQSGFKVISLQHFTELQKVKCMNGTKLTAHPSS